MGSRAEPYGRQVGQELMTEERWDSRPEKGEERFGWRKGEVVKLRQQRSWEQAEKV